MLAVAFHPDGMYLLGGGEDGIRRWQLADGQEVGKQMGMQLQAIAVSRDCKWIVCGMFEGGASVWDIELHEKVIDVEGRTTVRAVDVSPDSTRFATGTGVDDNKASVWSITTGLRLVGPLIHDNDVTGIRFSPSGEHIATSSQSSSVRIFDSRNGDQLIDIATTSPQMWPFIPLAWSNDGHRIFSVSDDYKIKSFDISTGSQLAESPILKQNDQSISLAGNGRFIATVADHAISFLDTSTLAKIGTAIENSGVMRSIVISSDSSQIATGRRDGKIDIYNLVDFLPDSYGPFHVSFCPLKMLACWITTIPCRHTTLGIYSRGTTRRAFDLR